MPGRDDDGDRPKKSWREIDAQRDRAGGARKPAAPAGDRPFGGGKHGEARSKTYRSQLDRLFQSGGIGKLVTEQDKSAAPGSLGGEESRSKRLAAVAAAVGPADITKAVDAYLDAHDWPEELEFLSAALEHRSEDVVREALTRLGPALAAGKPRRAATLSGRLRSLEELADDPEIRRQAALLRARL